MIIKSQLELRAARYSSSEPEPRMFLDFIVDSRSLFEMLENRGYDLVSCLGWGPSFVQAEAVARLLLQAPADLPDDRRSLYICHIDGDLGCGAVTVKIEESEGAIIWRDFGFEYNYLHEDEAQVEFDKLADVGPFAFDKGEYAGALAGACDRGGA